MSKGRENNCRLCLKILDDDYDIVEEDTRGLLKVLLLKVDLSVTEEPLVCKSCMKSIREAYDFKSNCLAVDERIISLVTVRNSAELDIRDVYLNENENKCLVFDDNYKVCQFCLQCWEKGNVNFLNDLRQNSADEMLLKCIPELNTDIIKEPVICTACTKFLETYYSFAMKCQNTEEIIMKYCKLQAAEYNGHISLSDVLKFLNSGMLECNDDCSKAASFKEDSLFQNEDDEYSDIKNVGIKIEAEELIIKEENMQVDCNTEEKTYCETTLNIVVKYEKYSSDALMFKCASCTFETPHKPDLKAHKLVHKDNSKMRTYKCNLCNEEKKSAYGLRLHLLTHKHSSELIMYRCEKCTFETKYKKGLKRHMSTHRDSSEVIMHECKLCSFKSKWKDNFRSHMLTHEPLNAVIYRCETCAFETKRKDTIKKHTTIHKDSSEVTMYKCNLCDYEGKRKVYLRSHMLTHNPKRMYKCESCTFESKYKGGLKSHMLIHEGNSEVTTYKCNSCSYKSKRRNDLSSHMLIHKDSSDVVMYKCERCTFETRHKLSFKRHMLKNHENNSGTVIFRCDLCSYKSKWKNSLTRHMLKHTDRSDVVMYKCERCTFETKYKDSLKSHMLHHRNKS